MGIHLRKELKHEQLVIKKKAVWYMMWVYFTPGCVLQVFLLP